MADLIGRLEIGLGAERDELRIRTLEFKERVSTREVSFSTRKALIKRIHGSQGKIGVEFLLTVLSMGMSHNASAENVSMT